MRAAPHPHHSHCDANLGLATPKNPDLRRNAGGVGRVRGPRERAPRSGPGIRVATVSLALYRTYRPGTLAEVVGQEHVVEPLSRALTNDRVHHAYLFSGPRGCGKTSTARILARSLNCERGPTPDPCGECASCLDLAPNGPGSLDVIELDAASHGRVDDTRDLRERAMFAPASSRYKVYIIDEAHMVTPAGFNALLKLVEEPPPHVRFIFATTEVDKVLPTIRSRTHNYTFRLVSTRVLQAHLARVCEAEGVPADPAALALVARAAGGSVRDALSLLGQLVAGSDESGVTYETAASQLGVTDTALLDRTVEALADASGAELFGVIDKVVEGGHDPRRFAGDLLQRLRDLIVVQAVPGDEIADLLDAPEAELEAMRAQASRFGLAELSRAADLVSAGLSELKGATAPRLQLELLAARLLLPAADDSERGLAARLDRLERGAAPATAGAPAAAAPAPTRTPPARRAATTGRTAGAPAAGSPSTTGPIADAPAADAPAADAPAPPPRLSSVAPSSRADEAALDAPASEASTAEASTAEASPAPAPAPATEVTLADVRTMWPAILEALKGQSRLAWMLFADTSPVSLSEGVLAVGVADAGRVRNINASGHGERLRQVYLDVMRADVRVEAVVADTHLPAAVAAADAPSLDDDDADAGELTGESLAMEELGATVIGEIEQG